MSGLGRFSVYSGFGLDRFHCIWLSSLLTMRWWMLFLKRVFRNILLDTFLHFYCLTITRCPCLKFLVLNVIASIRALPPLTNMNYINWFWKWDFYDWLHSRSSRSLVSFRINCYSSRCPSFWFAIHFHFSWSIALEEREHAYYYTINGVPNRRLHHWNKNWKEHLDCFVYKNYHDKHLVSQIW